MSGFDNKLLRYMLQALNYSIFIALIWYFATSPAIHPIDDDEAMLTIAFAHAGELREPCRRLSAQELAELAPNMRKIEDCPRERSPITIEASLDGDPLFSQTFRATGLFEDGGVDIYFSKTVAAGKHNLSLQMNDSVHIEGFNHEFEAEIDMPAARVLLVRFKPDSGFMLDLPTGG